MENDSHATETCRHRIYARLYVKIVVSVLSGPREQCCERCQQSVSVDLLFFLSSVHRFSFWSFLLSLFFIRLFFASCIVTAQIVLLFGLAAYRLMRKCVFMSRKAHLAWYVFYNFVAFWKPAYDRYRAFALVHTHALTCVAKNLVAD